MGIPVRELQQRIDSAELVEYMALYQIDARGTHYEDLRAGTIASMIANVNRNEKRKPEPWGPLDFIPWNERNKAKQESPPILLDDAEAQSRLIDSMLFPKKG